MKKIITACIDKVVEFDTPDEAAGYMRNLRGGGKTFRLIKTEYVGAKCRLRIKEQYNNVPLME